MLQFLDLASRSRLETFPTSLPAFVGRRWSYRPSQLPSRSGPVTGSICPAHSHYGKRPPQPLRRGSRAEQHPFVAGLANLRLSISPLQSVSMATRPISLFLQSSF